ncbi:MAG: GAF domain-containing protein [Deltaproteobacteria bacterium]|nr:GAF domain-containing protein [Deltaproteobacteria bacterium]MBW2171717.1 GAF domain-containing protein [Deltaproteobacteria bacterium]MBW2259186.1 GAF domain-containing protein [Deltaproteobacteria bacterium]
MRSEGEKELPEDSALQEQIEKLNQIGIGLSSETNLEDLLELIVFEAREFTGADGGSLYILDEDETLYFNVSQNDTLSRRPDPPPGFKPYPLTLSRESIAGYVAITGKIVNIEDVYSLPSTVPYRFNPDFDMRNDYVTRSMLVVPMKDREQEVLGVLQLINPMDETGKIFPFPKSVEHLIMSLASQAAVAIRNATLIADIKALFESLIRYSATAIDARSPHTAGHSRRVAAYSKAIALAIDEQSTGPFAGVSFSREQLEELSYAAWLHDIGKIGVPEQILDKNNRLSDEAMESIVNRFELIKAFKLCFVGEGTRDRSTTEPSGQGGREERSIDGAGEESGKAVQQIQEELNLIQNTNRSNFLSDEDLAALQVIASKTYKNLAGDTIPYLSDKEVEYLSVRKGNLTAEEYRRIQTHVELTYNIVENIPFTKSLQNVPFFSASHHELLDGSGYPKGLKGEEIPLQSRILAVVDIFDALTAADRPYRRAMASEKASEILKAEAEAGRLDDDVVNLFVDQKLYEI